MIPRFDAVPEVLDWRSAKLRSITSDEWESGDFTQSHGYAPLGQSSWEEVQAAIAWERAALRRLDARAATAQDFERAAKEFDDGEFGGEIGTIGLRLALLAAGFITFTSCRGHVDSGWSVPFVGVVADVAHLEALDPLAAAEGCLISVRPGEGLVEVYATRATALHELAVAILHHSHDFDALGLVALDDE